MLHFAELRMSSISGEPGDGKHLAKWEEVALVVLKEARYRNWRSSVGIIIAILHVLTLRISGRGLYSLL